MTRRDEIQNEHIGGTKVVDVSKKITEKRLEWSGHVMRMTGEHVVRRMLDVIILFGFSLLPSFVLQFLSPSFLHNTPLFA